MKRYIFCLAGLVAFAACTPVPPTKSVLLGDMSVATQAPTGYCVDTRASRPQQDFAILAPCATLGVSETAPIALGIATIQVGAAGSASVSGAEEQMRTFMASDAGATLLSDSGDSATVTILSTQIADGRVSVHFSDTSPTSIPGLQLEEWRSFTDVNGRLVTVSLRGLATAPLDQSSGTWLLNMMISGVKPAVVAQPSTPDS